MKEYKLVKFYPSLPTDWHTNPFPIVVVERKDGYHLHPSLKDKTRFAIIPEREVDRNEEFWQELKPAKRKKKKYSLRDLELAVNNWSMATIHKEDILRFLNK